MKISHRAIRQRGEPFRDGSSLGQLPPQQHRQLQLMTPASTPPTSIVASPLALAPLVAPHDVDEATVSLRCCYTRQSV